ncbi:hypothetical protein P7K49_003644 [Saguinus oedipus]|uniref:Uncharacterized protein n=1 Tax=Saguinus oedipus TaxID=9490 RepID=A0ABQ9W559_SAGOE|nr:hypothetical protein P7K49_003644 [Saguinus oedipus]
MSVLETLSVITQTLQCFRSIQGSQERSLIPENELPHRRVTFSATSQAQELQDPSQHSYYDSGLEESETPSSKSSSGPRLGPLALPEDHYERTTPDGSIGEMEHPENGEAQHHIQGTPGISGSLGMVTRP